MNILILEPDLLFVVSMDAKSLFAREGSSPSTGKTLILIRLMNRVNSSTKTMTLYMECP